ncbi:uncharacterized protein LOC132756727 [Ruditapes philippinarum]|uniref:uncharacterized protein LOC132756727 n=1 Tax=Ruditapes philippinarum TaxID=129788 RepID=UPI00295AE31F|nr:uncharacterized protein LOC132756727 [Ruditapes philippinarum]
MIFKLLISTAVFHFAHGITLSCVPDVPENHSNISCTCRNPTKNGIEWRRNSQIVTTCSGTEDNCFPPSLKYRSSVSSDEFYLEVSPYSYTDCATYSCKDVSTAEEVYVTTSIADFDQRSITTEEPGANTDGQIMVNTGCVFPTSNITITWYKIENGTEEDFTASPIQSSERSNCSRTCNAETDKKVESGFTHTEYTGSDYVEVVYKVTVTHNLYIEEVFAWTSSKYRLKAGTTKTVCLLFVTRIPKLRLHIYVLTIMSRLNIFCNISRNRVIQLFRRRYLYICSSHVDRILSFHHKYINKIDNVSLISVPSTFLNNKQ